MTKPHLIYSFPIFMIWTSFMLLLSSENVICGDENSIYFPNKLDSKNSTLTSSKLEQYLLDNRNGRINIENIGHTNHSQNQNESEFQNNLPQPKKDRVFGVDSSIFQNYLKDINYRSILIGYQDDDDFENWIPPKGIQRDLPTYLSGFDYENRPIWVVEYAKYNYTKYATSGRRAEALFKKYFRYVAYLALKSHVLRSTPEHPVTEHNFLIDFEGFTFDQILNPKAFQLQLGWIRNSRRFTEKFVNKIVTVNGKVLQFDYGINQISETLFTFSRSLILSLWDKIEVYGTNKANWGPHLLKSFPKDQIPEWYGGSKEFKPLFVVG